MKDRTGLLLLGLVGLLAAFAVAGCGKPESALARANREGRLIVGIGAEPRGLDPQLDNSVGAQRVHYALSEGLVTLHPGTLEPLPGVADRWSCSPDLLTWEFELSPKARWSDGQPLVAEDFVFSYRRMLSPALGAENASMLYVLQGAEALHKGTDTAPEHLGARAETPQRLTLVLSRPVPYFLQLLAHMAFYPVPRHTITRFGSPDDRFSRWTRAGNHVSNGPFHLTYWNVDDRIEVRQNPFYHREVQTRIKAISFLPIDHQVTEERAFWSGLLHVSYTIPSSSVERYQRSRPPELRLDPDLGTYYFTFNTRVPPLDRIEVRKALSLATGRAALTQHIRKLDELPAVSFVPPGTGGYTGPALVKEHAAEAREWLARGGFPGGQGFPELELLYNDSQTHRAIAEALQSQWKEALGIRIKLRNVEWKTMLEMRRQREFQILRAGWMGDYDDPETFLSLWTSDNTNNFSGFSNPTFDRLIQESSNEPDPRLRRQKLFEAETLLLEEAPVIPVFHYKRPFLIHREVSGWLPNSLNVVRFQDVTLSE